MKTLQNQSYWQLSAPVVDFMLSNFTVFTARQHSLLCRALY